MTSSLELLRSYLRGVQRMSGAVSASLLVQRSPSALSSPLLIHEGAAPPVPELAELAAAEELHKGLERQLAESPWPRSLPSRSPDCRLFPVPAVATLPFPSGGERAGAPEKARQRRKGDAEHGSRGHILAGWIGLRFEGGLPPDDFDTSERAVGPGPVATGWWFWLVALGGVLVSYSRQVSDILEDPVTGLPRRTEFQASLGRALNAAREETRPLTLLLVNPDDFATVNERFGREAGDRVIQEVATRFRMSHRGADLVAKYGGAIFASTLIDTDVEDGRGLAEKVLRNLTEASFLDGAVRLGFSVGVAAFDPADAGIKEPLDLIRRSEQALHAAKRAGGGRVSLWRPGLEGEEIENLSQMSGIFTGNMAKDYRNLVLLSHTVTVVAAKHDFEGLAAQVVERLHSTFKPDRLGLFDWPEGGGPRLIRGLKGRASETGLPEWAQALPLNEAQLACLEEARRHRRALEARFSPKAPGDEGDVVGYVIPLVVGDTSLGCFYLEGRAESLSLDSSDLVFLRALAAQLGVALDRARLSEQDRRRQEQEQLRLRNEVEQLRQAIQQAKLVYRSEQMEALLASVRRVAPTDATVLITGESGTGKELIARTIHELSPRRKKALVVVDCGAIPTTLIESELFGHEKGAYTGAQQRKLGRLAEADGATVLLDEIGELPLEVQAKLLRFVQEKQLVPVGDNRARTVDVRVIAATNRDLQAEVQAQRFRADLYYRLNVFRLQVSPLRERPDDVLYLANHYLETYALLYQKRIRRLTAEAEALLSAHSWPGNIRELQNRMMQAVILCEGEELGPAELGLPELTRAGSRAHEEPAAPPWPQAPPTGGAATASLPLGATAGPGPADGSPEPSLGSLLEALRVGLAKQIQVAVARSGRRPAPLGKWLSEDLLLEAHAASGGVGSRAAAVLGVPESTFRRRLAQSAGHAEAGLSPRHDSWRELRAVLALLVRCRELNGEDLLERTQRVLLEEVLTRVPDDAKTGAALLGISVPTFRRWGALARPPG